MKADDLPGFPKIAGEPVGAPWIFENHIQAKRLHSSSGTNPLIQVFDFGDGKNQSNHDTQLSTVWAGCRCRGGVVKVLETRLSFRFVS